MVTVSRVAVAMLSAASALVLATGCPQRQPSETPPKTALKNPLDDLPVVLGREAQTLKGQTQGIGTLFNDAAFQERKQEAARVKAEDEAKIEALKQEIKERYAYIEVIEKIKSDIEKNVLELPRYLERIGQVSRSNPTNEDLWRLAAIWIVIDDSAVLPRQYVDDLCIGQMVQKYLTVSDQVAKEAENRVQSVLTRMYDTYSLIAANYGKESSISRLEQHIASLTQFAETLEWVGEKYFTVHKSQYDKEQIARGTTIPTAGKKELFGTSFEEIGHDIKLSIENIRAHISICKVYNECMNRFAQLMEDGLQAKDVPVIDELKKDLSDQEARAPNKDSANLLVAGSDEMDARVEREVLRLRQTRDQLDALCSGTPDFEQPQSFLERVRKGQEDMRVAQTIFDALTLYEDGDKASAVRDRLSRLERSYDRLREMHFAREEVQQYAKEVQQLPGYSVRTSSQQQRATEIRDKLRDHKVKFSKWVTDPELEEQADECIRTIDELIEKIGA